MHGTTLLCQDGHGAISHSFSGQGAGKHSRPVSFVEVTMEHGPRFARDFYRSFAWRRCRDGYAASVQGLCERCLKRGLIVPGEEVHHKIRLTPDNINNPAVALNWDNLELLCKDCHLEEHRPQRWRADSSGHVEL